MTGFKYNSIGGKPLLSLAVDEIVWLHLSGRSPEYTADYFVHSALKEVETTMRHTNQNLHSEVFGPLLCAFAILDQLGTSYADKRRPTYTGKNTSIMKALHYFGEPSLKADDIEHLYMLRNGIVHDASFTSHTPSKSHWYIFRFDKELPSVIKVPAKAWDGTTADITSATTTYVNRRKLVDMTTNAIEAVRDLLLTDSTNLDILVPKDEIMHKYLLWKDRPQR